MESKHSKARKLVGVLSTLGVALAAMIALSPSSADALCMRRPMAPAYWDAHKALRKGDHAEALRLFRQAARTPGEAKAWYAGAVTSQGWQARQRGEIEKAMEHYRAALREVPSHFPAAAEAVATLEKAGRLHDALLEIRQFPKAIQRNEAMRRIEARVLQKIGDHAAAKAILERLAGKNSK